ncbi:MAG TPA: O-antigen ligase family protein, partial [bacterium]|nr:O-antigen ligase family protein [bacterium]
LPWSTRLIVKANYLGGEYWEYGTVSLYLSDIVLVLSILTTFFAQRGKRLKKQINWLYPGWLAVLYLIIIIGLISNGISYYLGLFYFSRIVVWSLGWWFLLRFNNWPLKKWISCLLLGLIIPAFLGISQFANQTASANKWLGLAAHNSGELGTSVVESLGNNGQISGRWLRAYGSFDQPNIFGGVMAMAIVLVIAGWSLFKSNFIRSLLLGSLAIWCLAVLFSWSRAAWLAIIFGLLLIFIFIWKNKAKRKRMLILTAFLSIWTFFWLWPFNELLHSRVGGQTRLEQKSLNERRDSYNEASFLIKDRPLFGVGLGNYTGASSLKDETEKPAWQYQPVHNAIILIIAEIGYLGAAWLIFGWVWFLWQARRKFFVWPLTISCFCLMMFDHWWWSLHSGIIFLWFFSAALFAIGRHETKLL